MDDAISFQQRKRSRPEETEHPVYNRGEITGSIPPVDSGTSYFRPHKRLRSSLPELNATTERANRSDDVMRGPSDTGPSYRFPTGMTSNRTRIGSGNSPSSSAFDYPGWTSFDVLSSVAQTSSSHPYNSGPSIKFQQMDQSGPVGTAGYVGGSETTEYELKTGRRENAEPTGSRGSARTSSTVATSSRIGPPLPDRITHATSFSTASPSRPRPTSPAETTPLLPVKSIYVSGSGKYTLDVTLPSFNLIASSSDLIPGSQTIPIEQILKAFHIMKTYAATKGDSNPGYAETSILFEARPVGDWVNRFVQKLTGPGVAILDFLRGSGPLDVRTLDDRYRVNAETTEIGVYYDAGPSKYAFSTIERDHPSGAEHRKIKTMGYTGSGTSLTQSYGGLVGVGKRVNNHESATYRDDAHHRQRHYQQGYIENLQHSYFLVVEEDEGDIAAFLRHNAAGSSSASQDATGLRQLRQASVRMFEEAFMILGMGRVQDKLLISLCHSQGLWTFPPALRSTNDGSALARGGDGFTSITGSAAGRLSALKMGERYAKMAGMAPGLAMNVGEYVKRMKTPEAYAVQKAETKSAQRHSRSIRALAEYSGAGRKASVSAQGQFQIARMAPIDDPKYIELLNGQKVVKKVQMSWPPHLKEKRPEAIWQKVHLGELDQQGFPTGANMKLDCCDETGSVLATYSATMAAAFEANPINYHRLGTQSHVGHWNTFVAYIRWRCINAAQDGNDGQMKKKKKEDQKKK